MGEEYQDPERLRELYWEQEKTAMETANVLGCSEGTVLNYMDEYGIPRRRDGGGWRDDRPYEDEALMRELYHGEGLSTVEIAERFGCSQPLITQWMDRHGIDTRAEAERYRMDPDLPVRTTPYGYVRAFHTYRGQKEHVAIHRLLAVAEYGLGALDGKVVHHKNHVPWDNRPENIELMRPEEHGRLHAEERWSDSDPNN